MRGSIRLFGGTPIELNSFVSLARSLRKHPTKWERVLWRHLRNRNFAGYKFRRQHPLDRYILDFYCPAAKLAIEIDGGGHNYRTGQRRDQRRDDFLAQHGIRVLRVWNHQVREELDSVLRAIWFALEEQAQNGALIGAARPSLPPGERNRRDLQKTCKIRS